MNLDAIAKEIQEMDENIVLIYAFNGAGKTQLSVAYKDYTKSINNNQHAGVYYNAYSEDLFVWDNDEENDGTNIKLNILPSSLNKFHSFLSDNDKSVMVKLASYNPRFRFEFNTFEDLEEGIESISFFCEGDEKTPIKISRGEERIFVWCFFLALLEADGWADVQDAHIFIDDPVSSLDDHNIFITADTVYQLIDKFYKNKTIIITTHHIGFFSILAKRLTKGEKSGRYVNLTGSHILRRTGEELSLIPFKKDVFLYHLHLLQVLNEARNEQLYTYHFALLRQLLENIASFLGTGRTGDALQKIGIKNTDEIMQVINTHSHKDVYYDQTEMMSDYESDLFKDIFLKLVDKYQFSY